jgi:uncharacterized membrane protein
MLRAICCTSSSLRPGRAYRTGIADIVRYGAGEEERQLRHNAQLAAIFGEIEGADIRAVDADRAALELVEARDELAQRRFARAGVAHNRHRLAGADAQAEGPRGAEAPSLEKESPPGCGEI